MCRRSHTYVPSPGRRVPVVLLAVALLSCIRIWQLIEPKQPAGSIALHSQRPSAHTTSSAPVPPLLSPPPPPSPPRATVSIQQPKRQEPPMLSVLPSVNIASPAALDVAAERTTAFPMVMLAHERPDRLNVTLQSLDAVRGIERSKVFIVQDGYDERVAALVRAHGLHLVQLPALDDGSDDANRRGSRIATAYKRALSLTFDKLVPDEEAVVVIEDDLLFSPDLMEYMLAGYAVLRVDPSLWCVSAWNDNGFDGLTDTARAPTKLLRTGYFPGLGWLLTRRLWTRELAPSWPREHWDHWMRSEVVYQTSRGRECLIPQVPLIAIDCH